MGSTWPVRRRVYFISRYALSDFKDPPIPPKWVPLVEMVKLLGFAVRGGTGEGAEKHRTLPPPFKLNLPSDIALGIVFI